MRKDILMLYARHNPMHPWGEDMFDRPDKLRRMLGNKKLGDLSLGLDVGVVLSNPTGRDEIPAKIVIARRPKYDNVGELVNAHFKRDQGLDEYPGIIDHDVPNFRHKTTNAQGIEEEHANGIGIEAHRLVNDRSVQEYGNNKDAAESDILQPTGVALQSYSIDKLDKLEETWGGGRVIYKPLSGALGKGIVVFDSINDLREAVDQDKVAANGLVQPFINLRNPIPNLAPLTTEYADQLLEVNRTDDRVREIRNHFFVTTVNGVRTVVTYPMLRTSEVGAEVMQNWDYTPLDPDAFYEHHRGIHDSTIDVGNRLAEAAGVPHLYGVTDVAIGPHPLKPGETITFVGDLNCRGPRLPDVSRPGYDITTPAQREFVIMLKTMAYEALNAPN